MSFITGSELQQFEEWNATKKEYPVDRCSHQLFEEQVKRSPDSPAVIFQNRLVTYDELNRRANRLARHLSALRIGPEVTAAICMKRSIEMLIAVVGILKAGGTFLPLNPTHPPTRLEFMLKDSQSLVLLTQKDLAGLLPAYKSDVICVDSVTPISSDQNETDLDTPITSNNLAYILYTSGSTGQPKAVMIEHKSLTNYLCWVNESLLHRGCMLPVTTELTFDASLKQLVAPLLRGDSVWMIPEDAISDPLKLVQTLGERGSFALNSVPTLWKTVLEVIEADHSRTLASNLTKLLIGGEDLSRQLVERTFAVLPNVQIWNLYGPTEATANATATKIAPQESVTTGRPISNTQIYILDRHLNRVPVDTAGEIYIGGAGVSRGYLNRPELTAESFIPDPFRSEAGARLYKTGDQARYRADGNIEFLGRIDHQVKIRGIRVELGEIEANINQFPGVRENVVVGWPGESTDETSLAAYLVVPNQINVSELRNFLKKKLPDHMIPSFFIFLDAIPLTTSGKVDRRALPPPSTAKAQEKNYVEPRTSTEKKLSKIWAEILGLERVGCEDNFFDLGGHSLLAIKVVSRVRDSFEVELPLASLFDQGTVAGLAKIIDESLRAKQKPPSVSIQLISRKPELPLSPSESQYLPVDCNDTRTDFPEDSCIHELFEHQAEQRPDAIALTFENQQLTYAELNVRANRVAHHLQKLGIGPEKMVGLCVERSMEMIIGLLGILKAGGAYVPLDPAYPQKRLSFLLNTVNPSVILTQERLVSNLPECKAKILCLDANRNAFSDQPQENPHTAVTPQNLAYVIFTSGSTGTPKGVAVVHRGVVRLVKNTNYVDFGLEENFLQFAPLSFDASTFEIWGCLLNGARLAVFPAHIPSFDELANFLRKERISVLWLSAGLFHQMTEAQLESIQGVRQLLSGGDVLSVAHVKKYLAQIHENKLINGYGPTENTVISCSYTMGKDSRIGSTVPIGRPIANTAVFILNEYLQPVPVGVWGELYVGGKGLARGYLNHPELTAEKFIPDPFTDKAGSRLYRTGDLVRYLPDGNIEFLGRRDQQIKIRGFRVEPGEVEAALSHFPSVQESVVIAYSNNQTGDKSLVGYLVVNKQFNINELRNFLKNELPAHMIPSTFIFLDAIPLTRNGKVDRRNLPDPFTARTVEENNYLEPRTPTEKRLASIWAGILGLERVGCEDNFFDLGGHSLLAIKVVSRVRDSFEVELPLVSLFDQATVAGLAKIIDESLRAKQKPPSVSIQLVSRKRELPLSFAQKRLWFLDQMQPMSPAYNIAEAIHLTGMLDRSALQESLQQLVHRHEILRTTIGNYHGEPFQIIHDMVNATIRFEDLSKLSQEEKDAEVKRFVFEEAQEPFDLTTSPLFRFKLLFLAPEEHVILFTIHHIIFDGWSIGIFFNELSRFYQALITGEVPQVPELQIQYADFARWQQQWMQSEILENRLSYWTKKLKGCPSVLALPTDRPRPPLQTHHGAAEYLVLSKALTDSLKDLTASERVTLFITLLAAFKTLLYRYTSQDDILVGLPIAGRNRSEVESLLGFFVNTLVLRTNFSGRPTFRQLLSRVREGAVEAYEYQDIPFERIVEELQPARDLSHTPLFQVLVNQINFEGSLLILPGLTSRRLEINPGAAKFDLTLYLSEEQENLRLKLNYNTDLFQASTAQRILGHFKTMLEAIVRNPDESISRLPLLTLEERVQRSKPINRVKPANAFIPFEATEIVQSIPDRFQKQVEKNPERIAVKSSTGQFSYHELNHRANAVTEAILRVTDPGEARISLLLEHDLVMIVGVLGVLKSGKTYVPMDPTYPVERLKYILEDSQSALLLTNNKNLDLARRVFPNGLRIVNLDQVPVDATRKVLPELTSADSLAYILYTSGSTGEPKGVVQKHRNVLHFIKSYTNCLHITAEDRLTLFSSYTHDAAVVDMFTALLNGATLCIKNLKDDGLAGLDDWIQEQEISIYHSVPAVYRDLVRTLKGEQRFQRLRFIVLGGEEVFRDDVESYKKFFPPNCIFVNLYGSTESTISTLYLINKQTETYRSQTPLGYPAEDTEIFLLNDDGEETEIYGEIAIRSSYLTPGYWQLPERTNTVFPIDVLSGAKRTYRTGDMGRLAAEGGIEFAGRRDFQVKIRGYRIELEEVEAVLKRCPPIEEVVVVVKENAAGEKRLVAYLVAGESAESHKLREFLKQRLPEYMIPSAFVTIDKLPRTTTGKVDRRALAGLKEILSEPGTDFVEPVTDDERRLAEIWKEILSINKVSIHDNFFELGGHSLMATRVISRIRDSFNVELNLRSFFEEPTIAGLVRMIDPGATKDATSNAPFV